MNHNPGLRRATAALTHPATLIAMGLLLLNDFVLKTLSPSWLTGKLSDFAGLFFLPLLLAAVIALIPSNHARRTHAPLLAGMAVTTVWFALVKTVPAANAAFIGAAARLGFPVRLLLDPTDLIALLVLPLTWRIWQQADGSTVPMRRAWATIPLAALLLMADAAAPDLGVQCVAVVGDSLRVEVPYRSSYESNDGGSTWQPYTEWENYTCPSDQAVMLDENNPVQYRWTAGEVIERSQDGGATWTVDFQLAPVSEPERAYVQKVNDQNAQYGQGPFSAVEDPNTGNIVFAMGHEGVLLREPSGAYRWVGIEEYNNTIMHAMPPGGQFTLLGGEIFLAVAAMLMAFSTLALAVHRRWWRILKVVIGWLIWSFSLFILPPAISSGPYTQMMYVVAIFGALLWGLLCVIEDVIGSVRARRWPPKSAYLYSTGVGAAYFAPLLLWAFELLPHYQTAVLIAFALAALICAIGVWQTRQARTMAVLTG